ncbi:MAG: hypothetical protein IPN58_19790 [Anaerolineales bacterium]|nr:hypothetical protein [Anaerolineales bacterium]
MQTPYTAGVAADFMLRPGIPSASTARATRSVLADGGMFAIGGRVMLAKEWERLRPGVFVATGLRAGYFTDPRAVDPFTEAPLELETPDRLVRLAVATGVNTRFYLNDRYFVSYELRYELDGHLASARPRRGVRGSPGALMRVEFCCRRRRDMLDWGSLFGAIWLLRWPDRERV